MNIRHSKIACISDLHYGIHQNSDVWHTIALNQATWFKQQLISNGIQDIIIAGDIFNNRNEISVSTLHVVNEIFKLWRNFNIIIIPGNHDAFYKDRSDIHSLGLLGGWDNITVINEPITINAFERTIGFCPWAADFTKLKGCDVIFGHFAINNFKVTPVKICDEGVDSQALLDIAPLVISGHFHYADERTYSKGVIKYLGCPYEMYWGDYGDKKGIYFLDLLKLKFEFIENTISPKHKKLMLTELIAAGTIPDYWATEIQNNIVSFVIDKNVDPDKLTLISNKIQSMKPLSFKIDYDSNEYRTSADGLSAELAGIDIPSCINEFVQQLDINYKNEVIDYTIDLYGKINK